MHMPHTPQQTISSHPNPNPARGGKRRWIAESMKTPSLLYTISFFLSFFLSFSLSLFSFLFFFLFPLFLFLSLSLYLLIYQPKRARSQSTSILLYSILFCSLHIHPSIPPSYVLTYLLYSSWRIYIHTCIVQRLLSCNHGVL